MKNQIWNRIDSLSDCIKTNDNFNSSSPLSFTPNSLALDAGLSNEELREMLHARRAYNAALRATLVEYEEAMEVLLDKMVRTNSARAMEEKLILEQGVGAVMLEEERMYSEWRKYTETMQQVFLLNRNFTTSLQ